MAKDKVVFLCTSCGMDYPKAYGKCPSCGAWNSFVEQKVAKTVPDKIPHGYINVAESARPQLINDVKITREVRIDTTSAEFNKVLGGGLVLGSLVLIGGEPGIGKSTLVLQIALNMKDKKILYVSGEESVSQLKIRAERIGQPQSNCFILSENSLEQIFTQIKAVEPDLVIVDSIQTIATETADSSPGSITQVRECASALLKFAKQTNIPVVLIGHITKDGTIPNTAYQ